MREIKFRIIYKNVVAGYERLSETGWEWMWLELNPDKGERWTKGCMHDSNEMIRNQFTGLKDDDGQEIYEGDIKKHHNFAGGGHDAYVVKFGQYPGGYGWFEENVLTKSIHSVNLRTGKVIGNIFDNPELLNPLPNFKK